EAVDFWRLGKDNFSYYPTVPSVETARQYNHTKEEKVTVYKNGVRMDDVGTESVKSQINHMITHFNADEVLFVLHVPGFTARKRAIELLAKAFIYKGLNLMLKKYIPFVGWIKHYKVADLKGDLLAGLIVAIMLIPQGMA